MNKDKLLILNSKLTVINSKIRFVELRGNYTVDSGLRIDIDSLKNEKTNIKQQIESLKNEN